MNMLLPRGDGLCVLTFVSVFFVSPARGCPHLSSPGLILLYRIEYAHTRTPHMEPHYKYMVYGTAEDFWYATAVVRCRYPLLFGFAYLGDSLCFGGHMWTHHCT